MKLTGPCKLRSFSPLKQVKASPAALVGTEGKGLFGFTNLEYCYLVHSVDIHFALFLFLCPHVHGSPDEKQVSIRIFVNVNRCQDATKVGADLGHKTEEAGMKSQKLPCSL